MLLSLKERGGCWTFFWSQGRHQNLRKWLEGEERVAQVRDPWWPSAMGPQVKKHLGQGTQEAMAVRGMRALCPMENDSSTPGCVRQVLCHHLRGNAHPYASSHLVTGVTPLPVCSKTSVMKTDICSIPGALGWAGAPVPVPWGQTRP